MGIDPTYLAAAGLAVAAAAGSLLLVVSDFTTLFEARTVTAKIGSVTGGTNHLYAMVIIGLVAAPMGWGAIRAGSQPAMISLAVLGLLAAGIALAFDLPDATGTSTLNRSFAYANAQAFPRVGFYLETLGAVLLIIAGGGALLLTGSRGRGPERDPGARSGAAAARAQRRPQPPGEPPAPQNEP
ncbi:MAG: hypothetical protein ACJ76S_03055 [Solirubrobacteraceae bacterium]